jgi:hypothetical protein
MSGDPRLGQVNGHVPGAHVRWRLRGDVDERGAITVEGGYQLVTLDFPQYATSLIVGHQIALAIGGTL